MSTLFVSLVILTPTAGLLVYTSQMILAQYWQAITDPRVIASDRVTVLGGLYATLAALALGILLIWILARYRFPDRALLDALVDLPFALPTAVASLTLSVLLAPQD